MFPLDFAARSLQGHWWGFISRNYVVWPTFLLMNVFIALKGSHFWFLFLLVYAVQVRLMKGHGAGVNKIYDHGLFFFFFFFAIRSPNFLSFLFPFPLLFFSSCLCIFTARLFWSRSFGLGGVTLSRQCGKMNFLKAKMYQYFAFWRLLLCFLYMLACWYSYHI